MKLRILIVYTLLCCIGCAPSKVEESSISRDLFRLAMLNDSLTKFVINTDSLRIARNLHDYLIQFDEAENRDTLVLFALSENITPTSVLNELPLIYDKGLPTYYSLGGFYVNDVPVLVRTVGKMNISGILDTIKLDSMMGKVIDSMSVESTIEPHRVQTSKLYRIQNHDSLILLREYYNGHKVYENLPFPYNRYY